MNGCKFFIDFLFKSRKKMIKFQQICISTNLSNNYKNTTIQQINQLLIASNESMDSIITILFISICYLRITTSYDQSLAHRTFTTFCDWFTSRSINCL